ncbi:MAG: hypothetical protein ABFR75_14105 [Acidobacteriota bacterium]
MKGKRLFIKQFTIILLSLVTLLNSVHSEEKKILETMEVVDVELPVRVFYKSKMVDNLKKEDFKIYENGVLQKINGFFIDRKKIKFKEDIAGDTESAPRYFILAFKITEYNDQLKEGIDHLFEKLFKKNDQLLIFINDKTFLINDLNNLADTRKVVLKMLRGESLKAKQKAALMLNTIESELSASKLNQVLNSNMAHPAGEFIKLLEKYLQIWDKYRTEYLTPKLDNFYYFARYLQKINIEKWVINFYQIELFPKIKTSGELIRTIKGIISGLQVSNRGEDLYYSRRLSQLLRKINISLNVSHDFPSDEITKLFYKVNTIFHSIFIPTTKAILSEDLEYKRVSSNIENTMRDLTGKTGGTIITSGNLSKSLNKLSEKDDILYTLTYSPTDNKNVGKIKVTTSNSSYDVMYDNNMRDKYIKRYFKKKEALLPAVKITDAGFKNGSLVVTISDYFLRLENGKKLAKLKIRIQISDRDQKSVFDQGKIIVAEKKKFTINLNLKNIIPGKYSIVVDVLDLLTNKSDMKYVKSEKTR